ncbi:hypothetical protein TYRP_015409 [Tyrophagus putrescentiae]|nr:hypothetical protein TYRP_015409 [Tyrophagus putrescentiae]
MSFTKEMSSTPAPSLGPLPPFPPPRLARPPASLALCTFRASSAFRRTSSSSFFRLAFAATDLRMASFNLGRVHQIGGLLDDAADDAKVLNADAQLGSSISSVGLAAGQFGVVRLQGFKCFQADFVQLFLQIRVADYKKASQVSVYTPVTIL